MVYLEELLPEFKKGIKIRRKPWREGRYIKLKGLYARDEYGNCYFLEPDEIAADDWEFYQEPIDWTTSSRTSAYAGFGIMIMKVLETLEYYQMFVKKWSILLPVFIKEINLFGNFVVLSTETR